MVFPKMLERIPGNLALSDIQNILEGQHKYPLGYNVNSQPNVTFS